MGANASGILKRNKYLVDESSSPSQIHLPRIQSLGRQQQDNAPPGIGKLLPPIGQGSGISGGLVINKVNQGMPPAYNQYILKPSKLKNISKPMLSSGVSGEKMLINQPQYRLNLNNSSNASQSTALSNVINIENQKNVMNLNNDNSGSLVGKGISRGSYGSSPHMMGSVQMDLSS